MNILVAGPSGGASVGIPLVTARLWWQCQKHGGRLEASGPQSESTKLSLDRHAISLVVSKTSCCGDAGPSLGGASAVPHPATDLIRHLRLNVNIHMIFRFNSVRI